MLAGKQKQKDAGRFPEDPPFRCCVDICQVHAAFLHRRKMMKNSMPVASEVVSAALEKAGLNISARAQDLSLEDFVRVHRLLEEHRAALEANGVVGDGEDDEEEEET